VIGFAGKRGRVWVWVASWVIPLIMSGAYVILMATSETDTAGKIWEGFGLVLVLFLWWLFRRLTADAALTRAVVVGDAERLLELATDLRGAWGPVYRALAHELRGDFAGALRELEGSRAVGTARRLAVTVKVTALVETRRASEARAAYDAELAGGARTGNVMTDLRVRLVEARLRCAEGDLDGAEPIVAQLIDDVRAGEGIRAAAHACAAAIAEARGDANIAARHRARVRDLGGLADDRPAA
jgi:hypothetical protein